MTSVKLTGVSEPDRLGGRGSVTQGRLWLPGFERVSINDPDWDEFQKHLHENIPNIAKRKKKNIPSSSIYQTS